MEKPKALLPLVKYECGCIGFEPNGAMCAVLVTCCDSDYREARFGLYPRQMTNGNNDNLRLKSFEPLSQEETIKIMQKMGVLLYDGWALSEIRRHINP